MLCRKLKEAVKVQYTSAAKASIKAKQSFTLLCFKEKQWRSESVVFRKVEDFSLSLFHCCDINVIVAKSVAPLAC
jgi:hypothetical protein